jgi:hypothetical protein
MDPQKRFPPADLFRGFDYLLGVSQLFLQVGQLVYQDLARRVPVRPENKRSTPDHKSPAAILKGTYPLNTHKSADGPRSQNETDIRRVTQIDERFCKRAVSLDRFQGFDSRHDRQVDPYPRLNPWRKQTTDCRFKEDCGNCPDKEAGGITSSSLQSPVPTLR